jgi:hypothetical protein
MYGFHGPFTEEVCVLLPMASILSTEPGAFCREFLFLQQNFVVSRNARLVKADLLDEDVTTLAYVCK